MSIKVPEIINCKTIFHFRKVVDGEKEALVELLNNENRMTTGVTGVLCSVSSTCCGDVLHSLYFSFSQVKDFLSSHLPCKPLRY